MSVDRMITPAQTQTQQRCRFCQGHGFFVNRMNHSLRVFCWRCKGTGLVSQVSGAALPIARIRRRVHGR